MAVNSKLLNLGWVAAFVVGLSSVAMAAPKLKPALLIKLYKLECNTNMASLKAQLTDGKIKIRGTKKLAATSDQLVCNTNAENPTIKQMNNKAWLAKTEKFILAAGVEIYAVGSRKSMAATLEQFQVARILAQASQKGVSTDELALLGNMTRAVSFTEAHVKAAQRLYKKK